MLCYHHLSFTSNPRTTISKTSATYRLTFLFNYYMPVRKNVSFKSIRFMMAILNRTMTAITNFSLNQYRITYFRKLGEWIDISADNHFIFFLFHVSFHWRMFLWDLYLTTGNESIIRVVHCSSSSFSYRHPCVSFLSILFFLIIEKETEWDRSLS